MFTWKGQHFLLLFAPPCLLILFHMMDILHHPGTSASQEPVLIHINKALQHKHLYFMVLLFIFLTSSLDAPLFHLHVFYYGKNTFLNFKESLVYFKGWYGTGRLKLNFPWHLWRVPGQGVRSKVKKQPEWLNQQNENDHLTTKCQPRASQEQHKGLGLIYLLEIWTIYGNLRIEPQCNFYIYLN